MTQCTQQWIFDNFLSGNEAEQGRPWWSHPSTDNPENHFQGMIPVSRFEKLFGYDVDMRPVWVEDKDGNLFRAEEYLAAVPDNAQTCFGIHSSSFTTAGHQFREWLIQGPAKLIGDSVGITNGGRLKNGAQAWVNIGTPEEWKTPQGVNFRPQMLWTTGFDGNVPSIVKQSRVISLCDNTVESALSSDGLFYRVKHTSKSGFRLDNAKAALQLLETNGEAYAAEVAALCEYKVTDGDFDAFLAKLVPMPDVSTRDINKRDYSTRSATIAANKREKLNQLYRQDGRVAPWSGTAYGVHQMVNTYNLHEASQRNVKDHRAARNMENIISGKIADQDQDAMSLLLKICDRELVAA